MRHSSQKEKIVAALLAKARSLPAGTEISTAALLHLVYPDGRWSSQDMFEFDRLLYIRSGKAGLFLDSSKHWMLIEGLPYCLSFIITPRKKNVRFDEIRYEGRRSSGIHEFLTIDRHAGAICYWEKHDDETGMPASCVCTAKQRKQISELIQQACFSQWEEEYCNPDVDGVRWKIELIRGGQVRKKSSGSSGYPSAWRIFWALKQICIRLMRREAVIFSKPEKCSFCGSSEVKSYLYGHRTETKLHPGKYIVESSSIQGDQPTWECASCSAKFFRGEPLLDHFWELCPDCK